MAPNYLALGLLSLLVSSVALINFHDCVILSPFSRAHFTSHVLGPLAPVGTRVCPSWALVGTSQGQSPRVVRHHHPNRPHPGRVFQLGLTWPQEGPRTLY